MLCQVLLREHAGGCRSTRERDATTEIQRLPTVTDRPHEPGDRAPAPGALAHLQAFVNTVDLEEGREDFQTPATVLDWLSRHGLLAASEGSASLDEAGLRAVIDYREAIRGLLLANASGDLDPTSLETVNQVAIAAQIDLVFRPEGAALVPQATGVAAALGRLAIIIAEAMADGSWSRLKACRYDPCRWAFYDHSKNRSGVWCSMSICGNKEKTRSYRARRHG